MNDETNQHTLTGIELLHDPALNKGTAFSESERDALGLRGLLPPRIFPQEEQEVRVLENLRRKNSDLEKYIYLNALLDRNERLFYSVVSNNIEEMMPLIYTPTVGEACKMYGHIFRRPRGLYLSIEDKGRVARVLDNWPRDEVRAIVVTDGERILGLGDLGADGMGIPIGKLSLYTVCAGVHPKGCLPITLDVGTNNQELLSDPLYIGLARERTRGIEYDEFIEEFVQAVRVRFPDVLLQFEDFGCTNAFRLLQRYRDTLCTFNDDIQGTGSVVLAGLYSAMKIENKNLIDQNILFAGAGEAGIGIATTVVAALVDEGLTEEEARRKCWFVDSKGLVVNSRDDLAEHKRPFAHDMQFISELDEIVKTLEPTIIIGTSAQNGLFTPEILAQMARFNERPIVFALSNPTSKAECSAEEAYTHTDGRAIFASGSPFPTVDYKGKTLIPSQGNNAYIFPGVGLGVIACRARKVTDEMFMAAAKALANEVDSDMRGRGCIYPPLTRVREFSAAVAAAVIQIAVEQDLATKTIPGNPQEYIATTMFDPTYDSETRA